MNSAIVVNLRSAVPPYEQIRAQIAGHIAAGTLAPETRLPTVRDLASDLGVAAGTVARAYRELEAADLVVSRRRHGTSVAPARDTGVGVKASGSDSIRDLARTFVDQARHAGLSDTAILDLLRGTIATPSPSASE